ncbi:MAG: ribonuclease III, partial [Clostridia bacterium]|nr:ribonuclease III [Clostridia bacterium]
MNNGEDWGEETASLAEQAIGYAFRDRALLKTCFTHRSYTNYCGEPNNERLEFLGDAVLGMCVTEKLFLDCAADEGKLTELRKQYVSKNALSRAEAKAGLMRFLRYSGGESNVNGKTASNLFEAVVAGIYLDGGIDEVKKFLTRFLTVTETENYKTLLQELVQERTKSTPAY